MTKSAEIKSRRIIRALRSGVATSESTAEVTVGTQQIQRQLRSNLEEFANGSGRQNLVLVLGDWGFGKTHTRMLCTNEFQSSDVPFIHDHIDGRAGSLSHLHRCLPRWLERMELRGRIGLRSILEDDYALHGGVREWLAGQDLRTDFRLALSGALGGWRTAWSIATGHAYSMPDYYYQHLKATAHLDEVARMFQDVGRAGLALFLDEAENISRQYGISGRRKTYETLQFFRSGKHFLTFLFVTDRFFEQIKEDRSRGTEENWINWSEEAKHFVHSVPFLPVVTPPVLSDKLASDLIDKVVSCYRSGYGRVRGPDTSDLLSRWRRTSTRSVRLLIRMTVDHLDLALLEGS